MQKLESSVTRTTSSEQKVAKLTGYLLHDWLCACSGGSELRCWEELYGEAHVPELYL